MHKTCTNCSAPFEVTDEDLQFYEKVSPVINEKRYLIPPPTYCPNCRLQRKLCFRNERKFYNRKCDLTGKDVLSVYAPNLPHKVYHQDEWYGDKWDECDYGKEVDFNRPFFDQLHDLWKEVPLPALWTLNCENATYNNMCFNLKNCYMNYNTDECERVSYCYITTFCNDMVDCAHIQKSELCYECMDSNKAYHCTFSWLLDNCDDCHFSSDLIGCKKCFGCHGLRQQSHCIFNEKVSEQQWNEFMQSVTYTPESIDGFKKRSEALRLTIPHICTKQVQCENCSGNFLYQCKDCTNTFDAHGSEQLKNCIYVPWDAKYVQDAYAFASVELGYEIHSGGIGVFRVAFLSGMIDGLRDAYYSVKSGQGTEHIFGCVAIQKRDHCILNKQYTKEEYDTLVPKVIEHMQNTGEWGEYMPTTLSPFAYNETMAQDLFPITKEEALSQGYTWRDQNEETPESDRVINAKDLPPKIEDIPDDILNWAIRCKATGKIFKITAQELGFYRRMKLPIPHLHFEERYQRRLNKRPPRRLWQRECAKCSGKMETSYPPESPEKVYCESCYLKEVY